MWREHVRQFVEHSPEGHWIFGGRRFAPWWAARGADFANPLVGLMLSKGGGLLPLFVLHLVALGPRYGNDLMRDLESRSRGAWVNNPGAIYPLLRLMEQQGLIQGCWEDADRRTRRIYQLTDAGRQEYLYLKEFMRPGLSEAIGVLRGLFVDLYGADEAGVSTTGVR